jgi:hypothetical protein
LWWRSRELVVGLSTQGACSVRSSISLGIIDAYLDPKNIGNAETVVDIANDQ